jgi:DNA-binding transcriptional LysR family regulator
VEINSFSTSAGFEQDILDRRLDVAFAINPSGDQKLTPVPFALQPVTWAPAPSFNFPSPLRPSDLRGVLVISNSHPAPMWRQITDWFRQAGLEPSWICRCSSPTVVAQLVAAGLVVSLLPRRLVQSQTGAGTICGFESELALHPSRMFAIYRFADSGSLVQQVNALGSRIIAEAKLLTPDDD